MMAAVLDTENMSQFKLGDSCEVYSVSHKKWFEGKVIARAETIRGWEYTVQYRVNTKYLKKRLTAKSKTLRKFDELNNQRIIKCICGQTMMLIRDLKKKCHQCGIITQSIYICPAHRSDIHLNGSHLCNNCAVKMTVHTNYQKQT